MVYYRTGEYSKALSFLEKTLEIQQKTLPPNHPDLATSFSNICGVYMAMEEHSKALSYLEDALGILQRSLPFNHPDSQNVLQGIEMVKISVNLMNKKE